MCALRLSLHSADQEVHRRRRQNLQTRSITLTLYPCLGHCEKIDGQVTPMHSMRSTARPAAARAQP
jgi:hypothetical protein